MKHAAAILVLSFALAVPAKAQEGNTVMRFFSGVPSGSCAPVQLAINTLTADLYDCLAGIWNKVSGGGGGSSAWSALTPSTNSNAGSFISTGNTWDFSGAASLILPAANTTGLPGTNGQLLYNNGGALGAEDPVVSQPTASLLNATVVQSSGANLHADIDNFPATQPVSGSVSVSNLPATQPVSGSVTVTNLPTSTQSLAAPAVVTPVNPSIPSSIKVTNGPFNPVPVTLANPTVLASLINGNCNATTVIAHAYCGNNTTSSGAPGFVIPNLGDIASSSSANNYTLTGQNSLTAYNINNIFVVDGQKYPTIASAITACGSNPCIVDSRGHSETFASTLTFPNNVSVQLWLGPYDYIGPASGQTFLIQNASSGDGASGSSIIGVNTTSGIQANSPRVTRILSNAANTSDQIDILSCVGDPTCATAGKIQGIRLEHFRLDGNNIAAVGLKTDACSNCSLDDIDFENDTSVNWQSVVTNTLSSQGTQFDRLIHLRFYNSPQCFVATGNAAGTSDFTRNYPFDWQCSFAGNTGKPGIELTDADSNEMFAIGINRINSGTDFDLQFDSPHGTGSNVCATTGHGGGIFNNIYGFHGDPTNTINVQTNACKNFVVMASTTENQADPTVASGTQFGWIPSGGYGALGSNSGPRMGSPAVYQTTLFTQSASLSNQVAIAQTPANGQALQSGLYRVCYWLVVSQAATTSSSATFNLAWNDALATSNTYTSAPTLNSVGSGVTDCKVLNMNPVANITWGVTYASVGATAMNYWVRLTAESLGH